MQREDTATATNEQPAWPAVAATGEHTPAAATGDDAGAKDETTPAGAKDETTPAEVRLQSPQPTEPTVEAPAAMQESPGK